MVFSLVDFASPQNAAIVRGASSLTDIDARHLAWMQGFLCASQPFAPERRHPSLAVCPQFFLDPRSAVSMYPA
jgi:hypothetical protein